MSDQRTPEQMSMLDLLRSQHDFPGPFVFRVVARPASAAGVVSAIGAALGSESHMEKVVEKPSRTGKYLSLHLHCRMVSAEAVLEVYDVIKRLDGVLMTL